MTRPSQTLQQHKSELITLYTSGQTLPSLCTHLSTRYCITCSKATLQRTIHGWGVYKRPRRDKSDDVKQLILEQFYKHMASDEDMLTVIMAQGYSMSMRALQRLRRELGCMRRAEDEAWEGTREKLRERVVQDMKAGEMAGYRHQTMRQHIRGLGFSVGRDRLKTILSEVDPGGAKRREDAGPQRRRRSAKSLSQSPTQEDMQDGYAQANMLLSAAGLLDGQGEMALPSRYAAGGGMQLQMQRSGCIDPMLST